MMDDTVEALAIIVAQQWAWREALGEACAVMCPRCKAGDVPTRDLPHGAGPSALYWHNATHPTEWTGCGASAIRELMEVAK